MYDCTSSHAALRSIVAKTFLKLFILNQKNVKNSAFYSQGFKNREKNFLFLFELRKSRDLQRPICST